MSRLHQGHKPTRAERKAEKKAAKEAAKQAEFDIRELAKEEKRAAKAARSRWGRKRRDEEAEVDDVEQGSVGFGHSEPPVEIGGFVPGQSASRSEPDEFLLEASMQDVPASPPRLQAESKQEPEPQRRRSLGMRIRKKGAVAEVTPDVADHLSSDQGGTQIRPAREESAAFGHSHNTGPETHNSPGENFANLRRVVAGQGTQAPRSASGDMDNVLVLDDPLVEPDPSGQRAASPNENSIEPLRLEPENRLIQPVSGMSENWLGLWVSEDGKAIFLEEDGDGWFAVTVLPDPKSTCYSGPDYPEIQSYRMPASWSREELGEFDGERLSVITVPGLPDTHQSPMMYIYFLTSISASEGGGSRFAMPDDPTRRVFIAADLELGTVNPWSDRDDIEWIDPSVNYYKAPGKLDAYMMRRMEKDDPLN